MLNQSQQIFLKRGYARYFGEPNENIQYLRQLLELDDQQPMQYYTIGVNYNQMFQYDKAIPELEKSLEIYNRWGIKPAWVPNYIQLGIAYHNTGQYKKEKKLYKKAEKDFPYHPNIIYRQAVLSLSEGKTKDANGYIEQLISLLKDRSANEVSITTILSSIYSEAGILNKAEDYYRKALSLEPENASIMNTLGYFLINKDRNVDEGVDFIEKALNLQPDNYNYLHTKGWGLYKQGKSQDALEILQKSWSLRREKAIYDHAAYLHLEAAKKAVAGQKNN